MSVDDRKISRRDLLKKGAAGAAALGVSGAAAPFSFAGPMKFKNKHLKGDLSIIQWVHFVPAYDDWFDNTWVKQWGEKNDVQVNGRAHQQHAARHARSRRGRCAERVTTSS